MAALMVCKALAQQSRLGPFYWPEVVALVLIELALFFGVLVLRSYAGLSRWWLLACPALFFGVLVVVQTFRRQGQALLLPSWYAWHVLHPRHVRLQPLTAPKLYCVRPRSGQQPLLPPRKPPKPHKPSKPRKVPLRRPRRPHRPSPNAFKV